MYVEESKNKPSGTCHLFYIGVELAAQAAFRFAVLSFYLSNLCGFLLLDRLTHSLRIRPVRSKLPRLDTINKHLI